MTIKNAAGEEIYSGVTTINGYYEVETDVAGEYTVTFTAPSGYTVATEEVMVNIVDATRQVAINNVAVSK